MEKLKVRSVRIMDKKDAKILISNKDISYRYDVLEKYECGIALKEKEAKSVKEAKGNLKYTFALLKNNEIILKNMYISPYEMGNINNVKETRDRKLLLNKSEILKISLKLKQGGLTLVPSKVYQKGRWRKVELCICKGKKLYDKREDLKKKDALKQVNFFKM